MKIAAVLFAIFAAATAAPQARVCEYSSMEACYNACSTKGDETAVSACIEARCGVCQL